MTSTIFLVIAVPVIVTIVVSMLYRVVVETNKVHIVQSKKNTTSYGTGQPAGNTYYHWPSSFPFIGVSRIILPVNNFELHLVSYKAYDIGRVPFEIDVVCFFSVVDTNLAAIKILSFEDLQTQLDAIVKSVVRKILAAHDIDEIMAGRAAFGHQFTEESKQDLAHWGIAFVRNMELMDIRDADGSKVISNIMAKKSSLIEMQSRTEVAINNQKAETAEIEAAQAVLIRKQESEQMVGERTAEKEKQVGVALQISQQQIRTQEVVTAEKKMAVLRVEQVKQADITKEVQLVAADQQKQTTILQAEGALESTKLRAEGIEREGHAMGEAEKAILLAPVNAQITLAQEIGLNVSYQQYLIALETIKAYLGVGIKQAEALAKADVKVISNAGTPIAGVTSAMQLFSTQGGQAIGGMIEALNNTPEGSALLNAIKERLGGCAKAEEVEGNSTAS